MCNTHRYITIDLFNSVINGDGKQSVAILSQQIVTIQIPMRVLLWLVRVVERHLADKKNHLQTIVTNTSLFEGGVSRGDRDD